MDSRLAALRMAIRHVPGYLVARSKPPMFFLVFLLLATFARGQTVAIKGKVTGPDNLPLPDVSVVAPASAKGTVTDKDGNFSLHLSATETTLVFSHLGFTADTVTINGRTTFNISLSANGSTG